MFGLTWKNAYFKGNGYQLIFSLMGVIQDLVERMEEEEAAEREQRELERSTCRIKLFCQLPGHHTMLERKLRVHKDATLKETTQLAHKVSIF